MQSFPPLCDLNLAFGQFGCVCVCVCVEETAIRAVHVACHGMAIGSYSGRFSFSLHTLYFYLFIAAVLVGILSKGVGRIDAHGGRISYHWHTTVEER